MAYFKVSNIPVFIWKHRKKCKVSVAYLFTIMKRTHRTSVSLADLQFPTGPDPSQQGE
jgi:hypothetical protein